ncbi:hypothetical protein EJB05_35491, partial [Eragrostis curvula]
MIARTSLTRSTQASTGAVASTPHARGTQRNRPAAQDSKQSRRPTQTQAHPQPDHARLPACPLPPPRLSRSPLSSSSPIPPHPTRVNQPNPRRLSRSQSFAASRSLAAHGPKPYALPRRRRRYIHLSKCLLHPSPSRRTDQLQKLQKSNPRLP